MPRGKIPFTCVGCGETTKRYNPTTRRRGACPTCGDGPTNPAWTTFEPDEEAYREARREHNHNPNYDKEWY